MTKVQGGAWCAGVCVCRRLLLSTTRTSMLRLLLQGLLDCAAQRGETRIEIASDVGPQSAAAALGEDVVIAACLRCLDDAKGVGLSWHGQVVGVVAGDLQKDAAVRPAFIGLPCRMLKAGPKADTGRRLGAVADSAPYTLDHLDMGGTALDIGEQGRIVAPADPTEMGLESRGQARCLRLQRGLVAWIC